MNKNDQLRGLGLFALLSAATLFAGIIFHGCLATMEAEGAEQINKATLNLTTNQVLQGTSVNFFSTNLTALLNAIGGNYATPAQVTAATNGLGSAAFTSSSAYATSAQGAKADTAVQPAALSSYQPLATSLTALSGITTNEIQYTNTFRNWTNAFTGTYLPATYQPVGNYNTTNVFRDYTNALTTYYQRGSANLTNFSGITTNEVQYTNTFRTYTNYVRTNYTVTAVAAGTGTTTSTNANGVVTVNATGSGGGKLVNYSITQLTTSASTSTQIPFDDTIPQSSEGAEYANVTYTPNAASNILFIRAQGYAFGSSAITCSFCIFLDSETDARAASVLTIPSGSAGQWRVSYKYTTTGTSSQTWRIYFGPASAATAYINQANSGTKFSTVDYVTIEIWEMTP